MRCRLLLATIIACVSLICCPLDADDAEPDDVRSPTYPGGNNLLLGPAVTGDVSAVAYSPDGKTYASGNQGGQVSIWDAESGAKLLELPHGGSVYGLAYSRDGRRLASCRGGAAIVWSLEDGSPIRSFPWRVDAVSDVELSSDGTRLYACAWRHWSDDPAIGPATVVEWDVESGEILGRYGEGKQAREVCLSPDGRRLLVAGGNDVMLFDTKTRELIKAFDMTEYWANDVAFGPKGKLALAATPCGLAILDLETLTISRAYKVNSKHEFHWHESPDGTVSVSSSDYEVSSHELTETSVDELKAGIGIGVGFVEAVEFGPTGEWFVTIDDKNVAVRWDFKTGKKLSTYYGRKFGVTERQVHVSCTYLPETCVAVSPDGKQVLTGCPYGSTPHVITLTAGEKDPVDASAMILWDASKGEPIHRPSRTMHGGISDVVMASDGRQLALSRKDDAVVLSADSDTPTFVLTKTGWLMGVAFRTPTDPQKSPELLLAYNDGIHRWDGKTTTPIADVDGVPWLMGGTVRLDRLVGNRYFTTPMLDGVKMFTLGKEAPDWTYLPPGKRATNLEGKNSWGSGDMGPLIFARLSPDGSKVLIGHHPQGRNVSHMSSEYIDGTCGLTLLDARDGSILEELSRENELYLDAVFSTNGRYLLVKRCPLRTEEYPRSSMTTLWDNEAKRQLASFEEDDGAWWCDPVFTVDSRRFLFGRHLRDTATGEVIWKLGDAADGPAGDQFRQLVREGFHTAMMSPDGKMLITGHRHGRVVVWSTETGAPIAMIGFTLAKTDWYIVAPDGRYDGTPVALSTLFVDSPSGCRRLPDALPEFHEPGLAGRLLPFVGPIEETQ